LARNRKWFAKADWSTWLVFIGIVMVILLLLLFKIVFGA